MQIGYKRVDVCGVKATNRMKSGRGRGVRATDNRECSENREAIREDVREESEERLILS